jgi:hypothetical protein
MNKQELCEQTLCQEAFANFLTINVPYLSILTKPILYHTKDEFYVSIINRKCCYLQCIPIIEYQEEQRDSLLQNWHLIVIQYPEYTLKFIKHNFTLPTLDEWIHLIHTNKWDIIEDWIDFDLLLNDIFMNEMKQMPYKLDETMYGWIYQNYILLVEMNV